MIDTIQATVGLATECDAKAVYEVTKEAFKLYIKQSGLSSVEAMEETLENIIHDIKNKLVFVACIDGKIVGSVRVELFKNGTAYLSRFGVMTNYQKAGIGDYLMNKVDSEMIRQNIHTLKLHTSCKIASIVSFYSSRGFCIDEISNEKGYPRALLIKKYQKL